MLDQLPAKAGVEVVSFNDLLCNDSVCVTELDGKFLYRDAGHLSYEGSEIVVLKSGLTEKLIRAAR
jgi:hypothetical protein